MSYIKINRDHKLPSGSYFLKGQSSLNVPYIQYVLALSLLLDLYIIMLAITYFLALLGPTHHAH